MHIATLITEIFVQKFPRYSTAISQLRSQNKTEPNFPTKRSAVNLYRLSLVISLSLFLYIGP